GSIPASLWKAFMDAALAGEPVLNFPPAAHIGASPTPSASATPSPTPTPTPTVVPTPDSTPTLTEPPEPLGQAIEVQEGFGCRDARSRAVSFDRPYGWPGDGQFLAYEFPLVFWLESKGYGVAYATDIDLHEGNDALDKRRVFISSGHDEYYSDAMRDALENALSNGTSLAFFGGNDMYRRARFEDGPYGRDRVEVNYKDAGEDPLIRADKLATTGQWRDWPIREPEQQLLGAQYECNPVQARWVPSFQPGWLFDSTGFTPGDSVPKLVGYEYDRASDAVAGAPPVTLLARSPVRCHGRQSESDSTFYVAPSGAGVFDAGTIWWNCGLGPGNCKGARPDERVQRLVANLLRAMFSQKFG
ncbi:MAG: N,N-dimethylformamidase beta subunit family domain-containing protein, partial [Actinomycetota bacterium]